MITNVFDKARVLEWVELALEYTDLETPSINDTNEILGFLVGYCNNVDVPLHKVVIVLLSEAIKDLDSATGLMDTLGKKYSDLMDEYLRTVRTKWQRIEELRQDIEERDAHWQSMIDAKNELIEELRERVRRL